MGVGEGGGAGDGIEKGLARVTFDDNLPGVTSGGAFVKSGGGDGDPEVISARKGRMKSADFGEDDIFGLHGDF